MSREKVTIEERIMAAKGCIDGLPARKGVEWQTERKRIDERCLRAL